MDPEILWRETLHGYYDADDEFRKTAKEEARRRKSAKRSLRGRHRNREAAIEAIRLWRQARITTLEKHQIRLIKWDRHVAAQEKADA